MSLQEVYYGAEIVVGIAVIISIVFVAIEVRQNTYITRKSMADQREEREDWLYKTLITDTELRQFHSSIGSGWNDFNDDEKLRATYLGVSALRPMLNELVTYFDGQISEVEFKNLQWQMKFVAKRPNVQSAYQFLKDGYPKRVQTYWETIDTGEAADVFDAARSISQG